MRSDHKTSRVVGLLQRSFIWYLLAATIVLKSVDCELWHRMRLFHLQNVRATTSEKDPYDNIMYFDYLSRLVPGRADALKGLGDNYWHIGDRALACKAYAQMRGPGPQEIPDGRLNCADRK